MKCMVSRKEDGTSLVSLGSDGAEIVAPGIISPTTQISFRGGDGQLGQLFLLRLSGTLIAVLVGYHPIYENGTYICIYAKVIFPFTS